MATAHNEARERIRILYPGDEHKGLRHALYSKVGFLDSNPNDAMIMDEAGFFYGKEAAPVLIPEEDPTPLEGTIEDPEAEAHRVAEAVTDLVTKAKAVPVTVETAEDYALADTQFAFWAKQQKDNEAKRKSITGPINESLTRINADFKANDAKFEEQKQRYATAMATFKTRERDALRKQEQDRQDAIKKEQDEARKRAESAKEKLAEIQDAIKEEDDPFLAALLADDAKDAVSEVKTALVDAAMAPQRMVIPDAVAPVIAAGSKTTFAWDWVITDESIVPRQYCSSDSRKINAAVKNMKSMCDSDITKHTPIPGITVTEKAKIGASGK